MAKSSVRPVCSTSGSKMGQGTTRKTRKEGASKLGSSTCKGGNSSRVKGLGLKKKKK
jgi:hypothetical protein